MVKDLGPQIAWRTVFLIEYLGPILIHPLIYVLRPYIYPSILQTTKPTPAPSFVQQVTLYLVVLHFIKREFETIFVHRFSLATMPAQNIFKNSAHYWLLSGVNLAYWTYSPFATAATENTALPYVYACVAVWAFAEVSNLSTHLTLKNLRPAGTTKRAIPRGYGFSAVTCPNYGFEILSWISIAVLTLNWAAILFAVVSTAQMYVWAKKKERRYRSEFGDKYQKKRSVLFPGLL
jgi:very-long-chain enoyl-CoA reductase